MKLNIYSIKKDTYSYYDMYDIASGSKKEFVSAYLSDEDGIKNYYNDCSFADEVEYDDADESIIIPLCINTDFEKVPDEPFYWKDILMKKPRPADTRGNYQQYVYAFVGIPKDDIMDEEGLFKTEAEAAEMAKKYFVEGKSSFKYSIQGD